MNLLRILAVAFAAALAAAPAHGAEAVKIGVIYPLTGNAASAGASAKDAVELGAEIVNNAHPELAAIPLAATAGLPNRGFKWIFRTGPIASDFAQAYTLFLTDLKKAGRKIDTIAIVNENTEYGTSVAGSINEAAKRAGINVAAQIPYNANSTDVSGQ